MRLLGKIAYQLIFLGLLLVPALGQTPNVIPGCIYLASPPTLTNKQRSPLLCDVNGNLSTSGGGGTPGGSDLQVQYNNAGAFGGMAGTSWDNTNRSLTMTGATITASHPILELSQTWNNAATTFVGQSFAVTDTASGASSRLAEWKVGGADKVVFKKDGAVTVASVLTAQSTFVLGTTVNMLALSEGVLRLRTGAGGSATQLQFGDDAIISRPAAASFQFGAPDAAAPVAQSLGVQSVVAWTSNTAGANWTIKGSTSTGSGAAGDIVFQTGGTGAGATAQNTFATALTIKGATQEVVFAKNATFTEMTAPSAPAANGVYIYAEDNGTGKTRLMAIFPSDSAQQIAIEP